MNSVVPVPLNTCRCCSESNKELVNVCACKEKLCKSCYENMSKKSDMCEVCKQKWKVEEVNVVSRKNCFVIIKTGVALSIIGVLYLVLALTR